MEELEFTRNTYTSYVPFFSGLLVVEGRTQLLHLFRSASSLSISRKHSFSSSDCHSIFLSLAPSQAHSKHARDARTHTRTRTRTHARTHSLVLSHARSSSHSYFRLIHSRPMLCIYHYTHHATHHRNIIIVII